VILGGRSVRNGGPVDTIVSMRRTANQWDATAALLAVTTAPAGREAAWANALAFLDAGHRDGAHLVASVLVVETSGLVLLARHRRYGRWGPLGGHLDSDDASLSAAAARELLEEAALTAHVHPAPIDVGISSYRCRTATEPLLHLDVLFAAFVAAPAPALVANDELTGLEWFATHDLPAPLTSVTAALVGLATAAATLRR
jgi:8-oxo-dGTP pyrophosphatase MutT (NUDIX family)